IPGTVIPDANLAAGTELGRFGYPGGGYLAPQGTPFAQLSLPPESATKPYYTYVVNDAAALPPGWHIEQSRAAQWFHQPGGGTQYRILDEYGKNGSVEELVRWGFLRRVN
ncbi:TNT domain-containing protein, partial [Mycolicibacter kumamotonensis]|uniref:TNT domain-containing protein n=1 Tax=Mycolicibacter kumamotonensis TaxID=354243 RepID=UPI0010421097